MVPVLMQVAAAILELEGNIQEHSGAPSTGILAFSAATNVFEFVVADCGIGLLRSLKSSPAFSGLDDHGRALELALADGTSRYNDPLRGHGFRPIFQGLTNLHGYRSPMLALLAHEDLEGHDAAVLSGPGRHKCVPGRAAKRRPNRLSGRSCCSLASRSYWLKRANQAPDNRPWILA